MAIYTPGNSTAGNSAIGVPRPLVVHDSILPNPIVYADNTPVSVDIPRGECLRWIAISITAQPTAAAGWTAANLGPADLGSLISQVQIQRNGSDAHTTLTGSQCMILANRWYGSQVQSNVGVIGTVNPVLTCTLLVPLETPNIRKPYSTLLNTGKCSGLQLKLTFTNAATVLSTASGWTAQPSFVVGLGTEYWPPNAQKQDTTPIFFFRRLKPFNSAIAAGLQTDIAIPMQVDTQYQGVLIGGPPMAYCTKLIVRNASTDLRTFAIPNRSNVQRMRRNVQPAGFASSVNTDASHYWLDFMPDGMLTNLLDARNISSLNLVASFSSGNPGGTVSYVTSEIYGNDAILGG